jgi:hypothetical protein
VVRAQTLAVRSDSGTLRISATKLHFLTGKPLERLHDGASVTFAVQVTLLGNQKATVLQRAAGRCAVSYDLWEERFAVIRLGKPTESVTHLTDAAAETWCLNRLGIPASVVSGDVPFWIRLEVRAEDQSEASPADDDPGFNLTRLVELFSRPPAKTQPRWQEEAGPLRLRDLR